MSFGGVNDKYVGRVSGMLRRGEIQNRDDSHWYLWGYYTALSGSPLKSFAEMQYCTSEKYAHYEMGWEDGLGDWHEEKNYDVQKT